MINITYESVISHIFEILALIFVPAFIIGCFYFSALGLYRFFKGKTKKELLEDNARLLEENQQLKETNIRILEKNAELTRRIEHVENVIIQNERQLNDSRSSSQLNTAFSCPVCLSLRYIQISFSLSILSKKNGRKKD